MRTRLPKPYSRAELRALMREAKKRPELEATCIFLLETGLRAAEFASIPTEEARSWPKRGHHPIVVRGKGPGSMHKGGGKERVVLLTPRALRAGRRLAELTPNGTLSPWSDRGLRYVMEHLGGRAGVAECRPHRFRHTFCSSLIEGGVPIETVADMAGHENIQTTRIYAAASVRLRRRALRRRRF